MKMVLDAIEMGDGLAGVDGVQLIDIMARHIAVLLNDALEAFRRQSYGTSVFLSITALEETVKAEVFAYRIQRGSGKKNSGPDPLRHHGKKHVMAIRPTTFMGRLPSILGQETCSRLQAEAESGEFVKLRERALYSHVDGTVVTSPASVISEERALEILLLACETVDDVIVGYTSESFVLGEQFAKWIEELRAHHSSAG